MSNQVLFILLVQLIFTVFCTIWAGKAGFFGSITGTAIYFAFIY